MNTNQETKQFSDRPSLPYLRKTIDLISRLLTCHKIRTSFKSMQQIRNILTSAQHPEYILSQSCCNRISCSCGLVYIRNTYWGSNTRTSEHKHSCRLVQVLKSAVPEDSSQEDHSSHTIKCNDTIVLATMSNFYSRLSREDIQKPKH